MRTLLVATCLLVGSSAVADDRQEFFSQYGPHYDRTVGHLWANVRVDLSRKFYDNALGGKYLCTERVQALAGASDSLVYRLKRTDVQPGMPKVPLELAGFHTDGVSY